jgi:uncharacterized protein (TIGR02246 family)
MRFPTWMGALTVAIAMISTGCGGGVHAAQEAPQVSIETLMAAEQAAWNAGDSVAYADAYTDDADFVNIRGQVFTGQTAVQQQHAKILAGPFKGSTIKITMRLFNLLAPGVVLVDTDQEVTGYTSLPPGIVPTSAGVLLTHFKYVVALQTDGTWKFVCGQNTSVLPNQP